MEGINKDLEKEKMINVIIPVVKKAIKEGWSDVATFGDHSHFNFRDENFISHYIHVVPEGLMVAMYKKSKEGGIDDKTRQDILVNLSKDEKDLLIKNLKELLELNWNEQSQGELTQLDGIEKAIQTLSK